MMTNVNLRWNDDALLWVLICVYLIIFQALLVRNLQLKLWSCCMCYVWMLMWPQKSCNMRFCWILLIFWSWHNINTSIFCQFWVFSCSNASAFILRNIEGVHWSFLFKNQSEVQTCWVNQSISRVRLNRMRKHPTITLLNTKIQSIHQ